MTKQKQIKIKSEKDDGELPVQSGLEAQIRTVLHSCSTANLYKLLQSKKVPLRSTFRSKSDRIDALVPILTPSELVNLGINPKIEIQHKNKKDNDYDGLGKRKDYPVMGIDIHKNPLVWAIADPSGIIEEGSVFNSEMGRNDLLTIIERFQVGGIAMESTAEYWIPIYWMLLDSNIPALIANPSQTKETQGKKTDKFDARRIALAFRDGRLKPSVVCNREEFALRKEMRLLSKETHMLTSVKNRLNQIFHRSDPSETIKSYLKSKRGLYILGNLVRCPTYESLNKLIKEAFSTSRGKTQNIVELNRFSKTIWEFLGLLEKNGDKTRFFILIREFFERESSILQLQQEGILYAKAHPEFLRNMKILISIPGIDIRSALLILAEIVDIKYFPNPKGLTKWAGLVPKTIQSGYKKRTTGRLHKRGNKYLRRVLWTVMQSESGKKVIEGFTLREFIARLKKSEKLSWKGIITGGARKLLVLIHHLLTNQESYRINTLEEKVENNNAFSAEERKLNKLDQMFQNISIKTVLPGLIIRLKESWKQYSYEFDAFETLCKEILDHDV